MNDITDAKEVEIIIRADSKVVWVNVDGHCVLRVCRPEGSGRVQELVLRDDRDAPVPATSVPFKV
jgi:hypothetical protein